MARKWLEEIRKRYGKQKTVFRFPISIQICLADDHYHRSLSLRAGYFFQNIFLIKWKNKRS